jgi:Skp family chaperone for outer membrane proteins
MKNIFLTLVFITLGFSHVSAENVFIDFNKVLNTSKAGAAAQKDLKSKFES